MRVCSNSSSGSRGSSSSSGSAISLAINRECGQLRCLASPLSLEPDISCEECCVHTRSRYERKRSTPSSGTSLFIMTRASSKHLPNHSSSRTTSSKRQQCADARYPSAAVKEFCNKHAKRFMSYEYACSLDSVTRRDSLNWSARNR